MTKWKRRREGFFSAIMEHQPNKDDLIVIAGAGGFIAGALTRYFHDLGYTRIRAIDRKPLPQWYQRIPRVECLCMDLGEKENASLYVAWCVEFLPNTVW